MSAPDPVDEARLLDVWILHFPLDVFLRAQEHADGLVREFSVVAQDLASGNSVDVPVRLLAIVDELSAQYRGVSSAPETARDEAIERGEKYIDLHYTVPQAAATACEHLGSIFDEADAYCRAGRHLLSLATPPESLEFRRWFLSEFVNQIAGHPPTPWP